MRQIRIKDKYIQANRLSDATWCSCTNCALMNIMTECVRCREVPK